ncbi:metallophosphoesterase (plasmid) [Pseudomonas silesiensis]|uniref:metallophosphoesterase n=1 Tax=Pseudomonas silesiensis TaxID=1853130 RepID=UPI0030CA6320
MYDVIGDIHGHAQKLKLLLEQMGYTDTAGVYSHPTRKALYLGDFIDRGPEQVETVRVVRAMVEAGTAEAVMGNHELNAVAFATPDPDRPGEYLRKHTARNRHPHHEFLRQVGEGSAEYLDMIAWFKTLPVYLDKEGIRAIHACWHPQYIINVQPYLNADKTLKESAWPLIAHRGTPAYIAIETLLKGTEISLPNGLTYHDKDGIERDKTRTRWWDKQARTYRELGLVSEAMRCLLPDQEVPGAERIENDSPHCVFFGHYWMHGEPELLGDRVACLDYSIGKGTASGKLCAYRWSGESVLNKENFTWVTGGYEVRHEPDAGPNL